MKTIATVLLVTLICATEVRADKPLAPREETIETTDPGATRKRVALDVAIGGGVLVASSFAVALVMRNRYEQCANNGEVLAAPENASCPYSNIADATEYANQQQSIARWLGTSLFVAGTAALGTALYLRVTAPSKRRVVRVGVTPNVSATGLGLSFSGGF